MIKVENVSKYYGENEARRAVLDGVSLNINDGEYVVILGASGSGKSTLLNIVGGLENPDTGKVYYGDNEITALNDKQLTEFRRENVGFVFQQYYLLPNLNVDKNVKMGANLSANSDYKSIIEAVGLGDKLRKYPHQMSGGEQQRVAIARALAKRPKVLFLDEPTGALDEATGRQILDVILKLRKEPGFTVIMVTHNANIADTADKVIKLNSGKIVDEYENRSPKSAYEIGW